MRYKVTEHREYNGEQLHHWQALIILVICAFSGWYAYGLGFEIDTIQFLMSMGVFLLWLGVAILVGMIWYVYQNSYMVVNKVIIKNKGELK